MMMEIQQLTQTPREPFDITKAPNLNDVQSFYDGALNRAAEKSSARFLATLYLLRNDIPELAKPLFRICEDLDMTTALFLQYRECESLAQMLVASYESKDLKSSKSFLIEIAAFFFVYQPEVVSLDILQNISVRKGWTVRIPLLGGSITVVEKTNLALVLNSAMDGLHETAISGRKLHWNFDKFTSFGTRISGISTQPQNAGNEFSIIDQKSIASEMDIELVRTSMNSLPLIDLKLVTLMSQLFKLVSVVPRKSKVTRKAGSVSSLPGWAWQDIDLSDDYEEEFGHLAVQLTHEFFHTKVNLIEKEIPLYTTDGNTPEIFSPWKNRNRPLRQVIHALVTFSVGALVWDRLLTRNLVSSPPALQRAEEYLKRNIEFAKLGHKNLINTGKLTVAGKSFVDSCVSNLAQVSAN